MGQETKPAKFLLLFLCNAAHHLYFLAGMPHCQIQDHDLQHVVKLKAFSHDSCHPHILQGKGDGDLFNLFKFSGDLLWHLHQAVRHFHTLLLPVIYRPCRVLDSISQINFQEIHILRSTLKKLFSKVRYQLQVFFHRVIAVFQKFCLFLSLFLDFRAFLFYVLIIDIDSVLNLFLVFFFVIDNVCNRSGNSHTHTSNA